MLAGRQKISLKQALLIYITLFFSPSIRFMPSYTAVIAKQCGYLSPIVPFIILVPLIILLNKVFMKHKDKSLIDIYYHSLGKTAGKALLFLYVLWMLLITALYTRYYSERLVTTVFTQTKIDIFILVMMVTIAYVLKSGFVVIARMNEIIFPLISMIFFILAIFMMPNFKINNITPISYLDIIPIVRAGFGISFLWGYLIYILFLSDIINDKENLMRQGMYTLTYLTISSSILVAFVIGIIGYSITAKIPLPFMDAVKIVSFFDIVAKIESVVVIIWILADFILISTFSYIILHLLKSIFNLEDERHFINIFLIILYFLAMLITSSKIELEAFSYTIGIAGNVLLNIIIPYIVLAIALFKK